MHAPTGSGRPQFLMGSVAALIGIIALGLRIRGIIDDAFAVPLVTVSIAAFTALTVCGAIIAASRRPAGNQLTGTGAVLLVIGGAGFLIFLAQPWRQCDYGDVGADCAALPADVAGLSAAAAVAFVGIGVLVAGLIMKTRTRRALSASIESV